MLPEPYLPARNGFDALAELDQVEWSRLHHAFGVGVVGHELHGDVARSLALLREDPTTALGDGLWSNVCHQGTVYEASAYAVPYIAAIAAGDVPGGVRSWLTSLLAEIAVGASQVTPDGTSAGSFGDGVDTLIRDTVSRCDGYLSLVEQAEPALVPTVAAIRRVTIDPSEHNRQIALDLIDPDS